MILSNLVHFPSGPLINAAVQGQVFAFTVAHTEDCISTCEDKVDVAATTKLQQMEYSPQELLETGLHNLQHLEITGHKL